MNDTLVVPEPRFKAGDLVYVPQQGSILSARVKYATYKRGVNIYRWIYTLDGFVGEFKEHALFATLNESVKTFLLYEQPT